MQVTDSESCLTHLIHLSKSERQFNMKTCVMLFVDIARSSCFILACVVADTLEKMISFAETVSKLICRLLIPVGGPYVDQKIKPMTSN